MLAICPRQPRSCSTFTQPLPKKRPAQFPAERKPPWPLRRPAVSSWGEIGATALRRRRMEGSARRHRSDRPIRLRQPWRRYSMHSALRGPRACTSLPRGCRLAELPRRGAGSGQQRRCDGRWRGYHETLFWSKVANQRCVVVIYRVSLFVSCETKTGATAKPLGVTRDGFRASGGLACHAPYLRALPDTLQLPSASPVWTVAGKDNPTDDATCSLQPRG